MVQPTQSSSAPIGVFDSGVGGLTVVRAIRQALPLESVLYLGDTARVPYGTKSPEVVQRYAINAGRFLVARGAKMLVIACNTASAFALESLAAAFDIPTVGVIVAGAKLAAEHSKTGRIGVIGTEGTIQSGSYAQALHRFAPQAEVFSTACPLFVPLAEEGMSHHPATTLLAEEYLAGLRHQQVDTLVLGCTHYPLLRQVIASTMGPAVHIIDSASAVAELVSDELQRSGTQAQQTSAPPRWVFCATDAGSRFARVGQGFLGDTIGQVEVVDL